jgi:hypothetical protein
MESVNDVPYKQHAVIEFLDAEKESVRNIHKRHCNVCGSATVNRSTVGRWTKRVTASETGRAEPHDLPHSLFRFMAFIFSQAVISEFS